MLNIKALKTAFLAVILVCLISTPSQAKENSHPQQAELISELQLMLTQPRDAFVVVEVAGTEKFIQFYSETEGLFIDLPTVALTVEENKRADVFFRKNDIPQVAEEATDPETEKDFTLIVWRRAFDNDQTEPVVELAIRALREIYLIAPNSKLKIYRGWE